MSNDCSKVRVCGCHTRKATSLVLAVIAAVHLIVLPVDVSGQETASSLDKSVDKFDVHPELKLELFAAEPMLTNPSNVDVDHLGRVWVSEIVNYRHFRNTDAAPRELGDRILVLEDTDGDAKADKQTVFYQGVDINSVHGICVLGDRVLVSAGDSVFYLIDTDGDLQADRKEVLFTGIQGVQHDHGIHAFVFGPDGKLYFNFGNEGKSICDRNGQPIVDVAGNTVVAENRPYAQGMVFRCNLDGSEFETLGWNFRNSWEVCIDSFGSIWQSDNDDDGNRATRINFVIPYGDYGYTDQKTGAGWRTEKTGMHDETPLRHWHQNDPGVMPNLLQTGAGSPTGICVYEGDQLPEFLHGQLIHTDAGPNVVRAYPVQKKGAGFAAESISLLDGSKHNRWFRPSDVCVAPDGSLIVADWNDPGVGGHRMVDIERGRIFRLTKNAGDTNSEYLIPKADTSNPRAAVKMLSSPNLASRYVAWQAIKAFGRRSVEPLKLMMRSTNARMQARALWALGKLDLPIEDRLPYVIQGLKSDDADVQVTAIRLAVQLRAEISMAEVLSQANWDSEKAGQGVQREILLGLRQWPWSEQSPEVWASIAVRYLGKDRWMLETLGIAAEGHWDECMSSLDRVGSSDGTENAALVSESPKAYRDIVWRSRGSASAKLLAAVIVAEGCEAGVTLDGLSRYFRAFDFVDSSDKSAELAGLAFGEHSFGGSVASFVMMEAVSRMEKDEITEAQREKMQGMIASAKGTPEYLQLVQRFEFESEYPALFEIVKRAEDRQLSADAMNVLLDKVKLGRIHHAVVTAEQPVREHLCDALVNSGNRRGQFVLKGIALRKEVNLGIRAYAVKRLGETRVGGRDLMAMLDDKKRPMDAAIEPAIAAAMHGSSDPDVRKCATERYPLAETSDKRQLPTIAELVKRKGQVDRGKSVFSLAGTCAKCHVVNGVGVEVGPDLSEIGDKLTKTSLFESILFPSAGISHNYETWMVMLDDGQVITGLPVGETAAELQVRDAQGILHRIPNRSIEQKQQRVVSLMPADLHKAMSEQELVDLVEYLSHLKRRQ